LHANKTHTVDRGDIDTYFVMYRFTSSGGARGHPDRGSSFPDRGAEVSAGITLPC